mgnify:FL=1|jgi:hypothetical protein
MTTKIIGNQIDAATRAIVTALQVTEQINLPILNQTQVNALGTVPLGTLVYNSTEQMIQGYLPDVVGPGTPGWDDVGGGGPSLGEDSIIRTNGTTIDEDITIGPSANGGVEFTNGFSAAPIQINNGRTVTIENGATWTLIGADEDIGTYRYFDNLAINSHLRMVPGSTFEFGQTKERMMSFAKSSVTNLDHSMATVFSTDNPTGFNGNFTVNFQNVPEEGGVMYSATVTVRQQNGNGSITSVRVNGSTAQVYYNVDSLDPGEFIDAYQFMFYLDGSTWKCMATVTYYLS